MNNFFTKSFFKCLPAVLCMYQVTIAQVPVNINSGNPNFPFPQFLEYTKGKTLAKYNAEGVTHADMEKAMREAYQVMANHFRYTGVTAGGVKYIKGNLGCPYDCAEGEGYAMLAAAFMGDQVTFNGLWMRVHDDMVTEVPRYRDGIATWPSYRYGVHTIKEGSGDAAADGDYDIALALLVAVKQWGSLSNVTVDNGSGGTKTMSYLEEAKNIITELADTVGIDDGSGNGIDGYLSGHIGHDGYPKGGNTFGENTDWGLLNGPFRPSVEVPSNDYNQDGFASYIAPAYFRSFATFLQANGGSPWCIEQFKRAEASTEWLMAQSYVQNRLPYAGAYDVQGTNVVFKDGDPTQGKSKGEAFRMPWRTILNYVWRGDGIYTWNPTTHQYTLGTNTAMKDNATKLAQFFKNPGVCSSLGASPDPVSTTVNHTGISQIVDNILGSGVMVGPDKINFSLGTAAPSAVAYGDETLIAELYRQCELKWDDVNKGLTESDTIIVQSEPEYFHGWFRMLGMMVLSGNYHAPEDMVAGANMKVYLSVDKTFAFTGDQITYTVDYRNYGKNDANNVVITIPVSSQYQVVNNGGGTLSGSNLTFTIGTVPGFKSATGIALTTGKKTFTVKVLTKVTDRVCQTASISTSNGSGWTSNEYPNNATYSMQRNCVDILANRSLKVEKSADKTEVNPGNDVTFTLVVQNSSDGGWLNGGRKNVNFSYAYAESGPNSYFHLFRNWNNAQEAYISLANYRVSYFMFDNVNKGIYNASTNPSGWTLIGKNLQTGLLADFDFKGEPIPVGDDNGKKWDQRLIIKFPPDITAPTHAVLSHLGNRYQLHKGALKPIWYSVQMESNPPTGLFTGRVQDDWSFKSTSFKMSVGSGAEPYFLIGPNYADPTSTTGLVMDRFDKDACTATFTPDKIYDKLLVEEFDGYTWRRVAGEGPMPGREMYDVVMTDTLPLDFKFVKFTDDTLAGVKATMTVSGGREIITWTVPKMLVGIYGDIKYLAKAQGTCPGMPDKKVTNTAWISSSTDSPVSASADVTITCAFVTPPVSGTTMTKTSDKTNYALNENINYTVKYKQTIGTISRPALNDATRWSAIDGAATDLPKFTATAIDFDNGKSGVFIKEKYSHGKNGTLIADIDHDGQETFGFVFRYKSGQRPVASIQGIYVEMQLAYWGSQANIKVYENGVLKYTVTQESYAAPFTQAKIKFELIDGTMKMWINDITGLPFKTFTGLTSTDAGYAGFAQGDAAKSSSVWSKPKILSWDAHFDSAFDLEISDPLPASLTFVSAANSGVYSAPRVTWPKRAGPVLYNDSVEYTFVAKLSTCPANGKIINIAYVNAFGLTVDSIGAQNISTCGAVVSTLLPGTIGTKQTICSGTAPNKINNLTVASGGTAPYTYQWELSTDSLVWSAIIGATDTAYAPGILTATTYFRRKVTDASTSAYTAGIKITITPSVTASVSVADPGSICAGETVVLNAVAGNGGLSPAYQWYLNGVAVVGATTDTYNSSTLVNGDSLKVQLTSNENCVSNSPVWSNKIVISNTTALVPTVAITANPGTTICEGTAVQFSVGSRSGQGNAPTFKWFLNGVNTGVTDTVYTPVSINDGDSVYVEMTSNSSCASINTVVSSALTIKVNAKQDPDVQISADASTICSENTVNFKMSSLVNGGSNPTFQWQVNGVDVVGKTDSLFSSATLKNNDAVRLIVKSNSTCFNKQSDTSDVLVITVTAGAVVDVVLNDPGSVCEGNIMVFNASTQNAGTTPSFNWLVNGVSALSTDSSFTTSFKNNDVVQVILSSSLGCVANAKDTSNSVTVKILAAPKAAMISYNGPFCKGGSNANVVSGSGTLGVFSSTAGLVLNSTTGQIDLINSVAGSYVVKNKVSTSCGVDSTAASLVINDAPLADFIYSGPYCQSGGSAAPVFINGGSAGIYTATSGLILNSSSGVVNLAASTAGTYVVTNTIAASGGCAAVSDTGLVVIYPSNPKAEFTYSSSAFCAGVGSAKITLASGASAGNFSATPSGLSINTVDGTINLVTSLAGLYTIKNDIVGVGGCGSASALQNITITVSGTTDFSYSADEYCKDSLIISPMVKAGSSIGKFTSSSGLTIDSLTGTINIGNSDPGIYYITNTLSAGGGCAAVVAKDTVEIISVPDLKVSDDKKIPRGKTVQLQASGASKYLWTPATDLTCTDCSSPKAKPSETITYIVSGTNGICKAQDTVNIIVEDCSEVFVPNAFNPKSATEENTKLCVYGSCIESMHLVIFDRWGEKVFETEDQALCWDGVFRNIKMNSGEFVYLLEAKLIGGEMISKRGNLSLME